MTARYAKQDAFDYIFIGQHHALGVASGHRRRGRFMTRIAHVHI